MDAGKGAAAGLSCEGECGALAMFTCTDACGAFCAACYDAHHKPDKFKSHTREALCVTHPDLTLWSKLPEALRKQYEFVPGLGAVLYRHPHSDEARVLVVRDTSTLQKATCAVKVTHSRAGFLREKTVLQALNFDSRGSPRKGTSRVNLAVFSLPFPCNHVHPVRQIWVAPLSSRMPSKMRLAVAGTCWSWSWANRC